MTEVADVRAKRNQFTVPCGGAQFVEAQRAIEHAATCPLCTTAQRAASASTDGPEPGTALSRKSAADHAIAQLEVYGRNVGQSYAPGTSQRQATRLLVAVAQAEVALYFETRGRLGHRYASTTTVLDRLANGTGEARP